MENRTTGAQVVSPVAAVAGPNFTCPECGSHFWGTSIVGKSPDDWVGHCNGFINNDHCKFEWMRRDDAKYLVSPAMHVERDSAKVAVDRESDRLGAVIESHMDDGNWLLRQLGISEPYAYRKACMLDRVKIVDALKLVVVGHQFQDRDGRWCDFVSEDHFKNTKADGSYPIRAIYSMAVTGPAETAELDEADRRAGAAERRLESVSDELSALKDTRRRMKQQWGVDDNVSFDVVWAEVLALREQLASEKEYSTQLAADCAQLRLQVWKKQEQQEADAAEFNEHHETMLQKVEEAKPAATVPLKSDQIEKLWHNTFSTGNPFCPCNLKTFTKVTQAVERAHRIGMAEPVRQIGLSVEQEPKYTTDGYSIINRASGEAIPADEPVFIFRARDKWAAGALMGYYMNCGDAAHSDAVSKQLAHFELFAKQYPERMKEPGTAEAAR